MSRHGRCKNKNFTLHARLGVHPRVADNLAGVVDRSQNDAGGGLPLRVGNQVVDVPNAKAWKVHVLAKPNLRGSTDDNSVIIDIIRQLVILFKENGFADVITVGDLCSPTATRGFSRGKVAQLIHDSVGVIWETDVSNSGCKTHASVGNILIENLPIVIKAIDPNGID